MTIEGSRRSCICGTIRNDHNFYTRLCPLLLTTMIKVNNKLSSESSYVAHNLLKFMKYKILHCTLQNICNKRSNRLICCTTIIVCFPSIIKRIKNDQMCPARIIQSFMCQVSFKKKIKWKFIKWSVIDHNFITPSNMPMGKT